jgi:Fur family ferric uptake transcriptional regulator
VRTPAAQGVSPDVIDASVEAVLDLLRANRHRVTTSRRLLVHSLVEAGGHRTAEELARDVQIQAPDVHLSTIYRNLEELERLGIIEHAHFGHGAASYHLSTVAHGHLVCAHCGVTIEVPQALFDPFLRRIAQEHGFTVDPHHLALVGTCASCGASAR